MTPPGALAFARVLHVVGMVLWIGGVAFVTTVLIPGLRGEADAAERLRRFDAMERRFGRQARVTTLIVGLSGFYLLHGFSAWSRYQSLQFWWVHLMTLVWLVFTLVLFVFEPLFLHRWFRELAQRDSDRAFRLLHRFHVILLTLSLLAIVGGVAGVRGYATPGW